MKRSPPVCPRTTCTTCTTSTTCLILSSSVVLRCFCALPNRFSVLPGLPDLLPFTKPVELKPARCFQEASWVKVEWNLLSILEIIGTYIASLCLVDLTTEQTKRSSGSLIPGQDLHSVESVRATKWKLKEKPGNHSAFPLTTYLLQMCHELFTVNMLFLPCLNYTSLKGFTNPLAGHGRLVWLAHFEVPDVLNYVLLSFPTIPNDSSTESSPWSHMYIYI